MADHIKVDYEKTDICSELGTDKFSYPVLLSLPHSGQFFPQEFFLMTKLPLNKLRANEDLFVDELLAPLVD